MSAQPSPATGRYAALPQAPSAAAPVGASIDGAARSAWQPNVLSWMCAWRALITAELLILLGSGITDTQAAPSVLATVAWTLVTALALLAGARRTRSLRASHTRLLLITDLAACLALLLLAPDAATRSLLAAYACSTVIAWAAQRPVNAFIAAGASAAAYVLAGSIGSGPPSDDAVGTIALLSFFALATSGFFTVAHRIGALEIATEISRERGRYRRDLHDRLGQALSGMHFEVQAVHAVGLDADAPARLTSLADGYRSAQRMLRDLLSIGDEPMVGTNVASVIRQDARRMAQQAGVRIDVETTGDPSRVPAWMRPHVIAVAGECVNNAVKNGQATGIDVSIDVTDEVAVVSVTDDGIGFDNPPGTITEKEGHYGLREMAERARICGGEVVIASQVGFGTRVRLQVPLPDGATQDILERDVSRLRENVWTLVAALRVALGAVAVGQLGWWAATHGAHRVEALVISTLMLLDIALVAACSQRLRRRIARSELWISAYSLGVVAVLALSVARDLPPAVLIYAPLALLGVGVAVGRRAAARQTALLLGAACAVALAVSLTRRGAELETLLVHITDIALMGMAAVQGAKLLDRLETLQIRVRYQALAQLRRGLSGRMRDQLTARLEQLERTARVLADTGTAASADEFAEQTARIQTQSTELKQRLRDIVHTLAEPPAPTSPGKARAHV